GAGRGPVPRLGRGGLAPPARLCRAPPRPLERDPALAGAARLAARGAAGRSRTERSWTSLAGTGRRRGRRDRRLARGDAARLADPVARRRARGARPRPA